MNCIYCKNELHRIEIPTPYALKIRYKCPHCDFALSYPSDHPDDITIYFPSEEKSEKES